MKKLILKFVCDKKKGIFVAFHFYFLLDLFQTALSTKDICSFFILELSQIPTSQFHRIHLRLGNVLYQAGEPLKKHQY